MLALSLYNITIIYVFPVSMPCNFFLIDMMFWVKGTAVKRLLVTNVVVRYGGRGRVLLPCH